MNKISRLTALLLALMMILSAFAAAETSYQVGQLTTEQWQQMVDEAEAELYIIEPGDSGKKVTPEIPAQPVRGAFAPYTDGTITALIISEDVVSAARTASGVAVLTHSAAGRWQMLVGDVWADVSGETGTELWVTPEMMHGTASAEFRKALADGAFTQTAKVTVVESAPMELTAAVRADENTSEENDGASADAYSLQRANEGLQKHLITINYLFQSNGEVAANPYYAEISTTTATFYATVKHPTIVGYQPVENPEAALPAGFVYDATQITIDNAAIESDVTINVYYKPAEVTYTVNYWEERTVYTIDPATGEEVKYDLADTRTYTGLTESTVKASSPDPDAEQYWAGQHTPQGFMALLYDENVKLAADGSTVVDVYYQRLYTLIVFNLGGGYGVNPIYAKHGTEVGEVDVPKRPGYEFMGWNTDIPKTVPVGNRTIIALWKPLSNFYTVVYWAEDLGGDGYSYWGEKFVEADSGTSLVPAEVGETHTAESAAIDDAGYFTYDADMTAALNEKNKTITVAGDGSTIVNVYYSRNSYTIRFIYARTHNGKYTLADLTGCGTYNNEHSANAKHTLKNTTWGNYVVDAVPTVNPAFKDKIDSFTEDGYTYYYIYITAEFGANIEDMWPAAPLPDVGKYYFGSWGAQCGSPYRETYGNEHANIVGAYPVMSKEMIVDPADSIAQTMVAWWADADDHVSEHTYHIYYEALPGETGDAKYGDVDYVHASDIDFTCAHNNNTRVDPFTYEGFICVNEDKGKQSQSTNYKNNKLCPYHGMEGNHTYCNVFYYNRERYTLSFFNYNKESEKPADRTLMFDESFSNYKPAEDPTEPKNVQSGTMRFVGWYTTPEGHEGTEVDWNSTMPAGDVTVYAKWEPITHRVKVYTTKEEVDRAAAGDTSVVPLYQWDVDHGKATSSAYTFDNPDQFDPGSSSFKPPENPGMTFTYWFYIKDGKEEPFSFNNTPITEDTIVYAGWTADSLASYTIYYVKEGTAADEVAVEANWVAAPTYGNGLVGANTTERAKGGTELYDDYQTGYFPTLESHSFTLGVDASKNVYVFVYKTVAAVPYQVHYVTTENPGNGAQQIEIDGVTYYKLAGTKTVLENSKAVVTENYLQVGGNYVPDAFQKRLILKAESSIEDNVIVFYYTRDVKRTTVEINHYLVNADDGEPVLDNSVREIVMLPYTATVTPKTIANYTYDETRTTRKEGSGEAKPDSSLEISLQENAEGLVLNLYYVEQTVDIKYIAVGPEDATGYGMVTPESEKVGVVTGMTGSTATAGEHYTLTGWYSDAACTVRVSTESTYIPARVNGVHVGATYYAKFEENEATLKYAVATGCEHMGVVDPASETLKILTGIAEGSAATANANYEFVGWYATADGSGDTLSTNVNYVPTKAADAPWDDGITYYAKFKEKQATINYVVVGPMNCGTVDPASETVDAVTGAPAGSAAAANATFTFVGWYLDEACEQPVDAAWVANDKIVPVKDSAAVWPDVTTYYAKFEQLPGQLNITKTVVNNTGKPLTVTKFEFTVTLKDQNGNWLTGEVTCTINGAETTRVLVDGAFTLELDVGQLNGTQAGETASAKATVLNLPHGTQYTVKESHVDDCLMEYENTAGTITAAETTTARFTNTFPAPTTSTLTVTKEGMKPGESAIVKVVVNGYTYMLALNGTQPSQIITGLPIGSTYRVEEINSWTWQYNNTSAVEGKILRDGSTVTIKNEPTNDNRLHDESYLINDLGAGSSSGVNR